MEGFWNNPLDYWVNSDNIYFTYELAGFKFYRLE